MALTNCDECGEKLSEHAKACPHCAAPAKIALRTFRQERLEQERLEKQERRKKVVIDHAVIEGGIRKALNKPEGDLTKGDLEQLTSLDLRENQITDLTPLKDFTQLTRLNLDENQITDLTPLKDLTELTELKCDDNLAIPNRTPWWEAFLDEVKRFFR